MKHEVKVLVGDYYECMSFFFKPRILLWSVSHLLASKTLAFLSDVLFLVLMKIYSYLKNEETTANYSVFLN